MLHNLGTIGKRILIDIFTGFKLNIFDAFIIGMLMIGYGLSIVNGNVYELSLNRDSIEPQWIGWVIAFYGITRVTTSAVDTTNELMHSKFGKTLMRYFIIAFGLLMIRITKADVSANNDR